MSEIYILNNHTFCTPPSYSPHIRPSVSAQPKDLVQALSYTAERDTQAMKTIAECFAPYLHQRAMELRPAADSSSGGGGGAVNNRQASRAGRGGSSSRP